MRKWGKKMKTLSPRTLLAVRRERELVELSIVLYRRLRTATGRECAEQFTHQKNRETIADIKGLVSAYAALKDAVEIPSEFFTTKILLRISMQIMVILQARTRDPIAIFKRIYDREVAAQTYLKEKDPYIIYAARVDEHFGFPITTLLCPALNYARYLLKGGVIRRAIAKSIIAAHLDATIHDEHERTRQRIEESHGLIQNILSTLGTILSSITTAARQIIKSINTRNIDGLDITGPRSPECRDQVFAVVVFLANPRHPQSIHHACDRTFRPIKNGYKDQDSLFSWCTRNESRLWAWVETYRLNHDIT